MIPTVNSLGWGGFRPAPPVGPHLTRKRYWRMAIPSNADDPRGSGPRLRRGRWRWPAHVAKVIAAVSMALAVGGFPFAAGIAFAAPNPNSGFQFSAEPYSTNAAQQRSDYTYELLAGHQLLDQFVVKNPSTSAESFLVYGEDATNVPATGGYAFQQRSQMHNTAVGLWLNIGTPHFTVPPGKEVVATFQLSIPANASPGDHVGGVVVEEVKTPADQTSPVGVNVVLRRVIPTYVRVVGKSFPQLTIEKLSVFHQSPAFPFLNRSKVAVRFNLVNTGNEIVDPRSVTVSITGQLSGTIHKFIVRQTGAQQSRANPLPLQMLPGATLTLTEVWSGIPPFDPLSGHVSATALDPGTALSISTAASTPFWYFPWIVVLLFLLLVAAVIAVVVIRRRRKAASGDAPRGPQSDPSNGGPTRSASMSGVATLEQAGI